MENSTPVASVSVRHAWCARVVSSHAQ